MELLCSGSIRYFDGEQLSFKAYKKQIGEVGVKVETPIPNTFIQIHQISDGGMDFSLFYLNKEDRFHLEKGETINHRQDGNPISFKMNFSIVE